MQTGKESEHNGKENAEVETLPDVRPDPVAILCADIHLSETAPPARSAETNWFETQARVLKLVGKIADKFDVPIICAGDVFDKWNPSPSLLNLALDIIPDDRGFYAIPGQHDLPYHRYEDIKKSAYWTMVKAGKITHIDGVYAMNRGFILHGFRWGEPVRPLVYSRKGLHLAVVHAYIWRRGFSFPNAPENATVSEWNPKLRGYDAAVFGDNHKGFLAIQKHPCNILNCGTLMRRKIDEIDYHPCVGILNKDKSIIRYRLDTSKDKFICADKDLCQVEDQDFTDFIEELKTLADKGLDFAEILHQRVNDGSISDGARQVILQAMEE